MISKVPVVRYCKLFLGYDISDFQRLKKTMIYQGSPMKDLLISTEKIIDCLNDGVYVCDRNRRIVYWSKSAERITGWRSEDVLVRACLEDILNHVDKDGHRLCGEEYCPLHR
jgi:PAS domain-containing protein